MKQEDYTILDSTFHTTAKGMAGVVLIFHKPTQEYRAYIGGFSYDNSVDKNDDEHHLVSLGQQISETAMVGWFHNYFKTKAHEERWV